MSIELLDIVLLVQHGTHAIVALVHVVRVRVAVVVVVVTRDVAFVPQVEGEVDHALLGVEVFLLKKLWCLISLIHLQRCLFLVH